MSVLPDLLVVSPGAGPDAWVGEAGGPDGKRAFGGLLEAGRIGSATNNLGFMYELDAIAACVVGGVSFSGGVGTVFGVVTGVIIFTVINYGLTYIGVNPYWQYIIKGGIIIFAVALDSLKYARKK